MSKVRCFRVNDQDNVATLLDDGTSGPVQLLGAGGEVSVTLREPVKLGHKLALIDIAAGEPILKFGEVIGRASQLIKQGSWVHLHNVTSEFDERSQTLDVVTGAVTDTKYE